MTSDDVTSFSLDDLALPWQVFRATSLLGYRYGYVTVKGDMKFHMKFHEMIFVKIFLIINVFLEKTLFCVN